jgi:hypothetical protein
MMKPTSIATFLCVIEKNLIVLQAKQSEASPMPEISILYTPKVSKASVS